MEKYERQLPEGMELIARALKAGHAFTSGMRMAADEFDDPLGPELDYTLDELNFGISMQDALNRMTTRVDCMDLKYFVVSVVLQRETGGNLAEIIETSARIIRLRFKFQGKVKTLVAEAKLSAIVLDLVPFAEWLLRAVGEVQVSAPLLSLGLVLDIEFSTDDPEVAVGDEEEHTRLRFRDEAD